MKRKLYERLLKWKREDAGSCAVLIDGARRVGKSWIAEEFARMEYRSYLLIDCSKAPNEVKDLFWNYLEPDKLDTFFLKLSEHYGVRLFRRESLIIFDEVQEFPRAREAIKPLVSDGRYDYLETGSLVSINENVQGIVIPSEEERIKMYPMDFEEFLWAKGDTMTMGMIRSHYEAREPLGRLLHRKAEDAFREYMVVGGMPQAVETFVKTADLSAVDRIKRRILALYRADIEKHAGRHALHVKGVMDAIPSQLSKHEKRFVLSSVKKDARRREYEYSFLWLREAMVTNMCSNATEPNLGLALSAEHSTFKCYLADTGLLISMAFSERMLVAEQIHKRLLFDALEINKGMLTENIVAQMLTASGHELFFFSRNDSPSRKDWMEIDFLVAKPQLTRRKNIIPLEVKSSRKYDHTSLDKFTAKYRAFLSTPIVFHTKDVIRKDGIDYLPLYMVPCL